MLTDIDIFIFALLLNLVTHLWKWLNFNVHLSSDYANILMSGLICI